MFKKIDSDIKVYYKPTKKWWEVWKRNRYLKKTEYELESGILKVNKFLNGQITVDYKNK